MAETFPRYTLKIYDASDVLQYTLTSEALSIITHMGLNEDVGWFTIVLPTVQAGIPSSYAYTDIAKNWRVKLWLDWDTATDTGTPEFMGKVVNTQTVNPDEQGFVRIISGKGNSEILERRIKSRTVYPNIAADLVFIELASDLSLTDDFDADASLVTLTVDEESYLNFTKRLSDYWVNAGTQLKKDFLVDARNYFVWKDRPMRTAGVETLSTFLDHNVIRDGTQIKNNIKVYGRKVPYVGLTDASNQFQVYQIFGRKDPTDGDGYTYAAGWTATTGTLSQANAAPVPQVGSDYLKCTVPGGAPFHCDFQRDFTAPVSCEGYAGYGAVEWWSFRHSLGNTTCRLLCPDDSNYYYLGFVTSDVDDTWKFHRYSLGLANTYSAANPTGQWTASGSPDWERITGIRFINVTGTASGQYMGIDGLCFNFGRWRSSASNGLSQTNYGQNDLTVINDDLNSDAECQTHAETLLYQRKDPVVRLDLKVQGNNNILVGDRLAITLAAEGISAQNFYVTSVEHHFSKPDSWVTIATLVDSVNTRRAPNATPQDAVLSELRRQREIGMGRLSKIG